MPNGRNPDNMPKPLLVSGNIANAFNLWIQQYECFEEATQIQKKPAKVQVGMASIGTEALIIFNTFVLAPEERSKVTVIKKSFSIKY